MMKRMDLFCTSPASTAICTSLDQRSIVPHGRTRLHRRTDHVRRPHSSDRPRIQTQVPIPCTSYQFAITPRPKSHYEDFCRLTGDGKQTGEPGLRKSSANVRDLISPPGSSRYLLLSDKPFVEPASESDRSTALVPIQPVTSRHSDTPDDSPSLKASYSTRSRDQVVVLRVSLHCKGCESKVRKHLSRMEGVRSFSIDMENKKVTVKGELTPLSVLASVSRVKSAQLWSSPTSSSSSPRPSWSA